MKKKNFIMDFIVGIFAITLILFSASNLKYKSNNEIIDKELQATGTPPSSLVYTNAIFSNLTGLEEDPYGTDINFPIIYNNDTGAIPAYCMDYEKKAPVSGITYSGATLVSDKLAYAMKKANDEGLLVAKTSLLTSNDVTVTGGSQLKYYVFQLIVHRLDGQQGMFTNAFNKTDKISATDAEKALDYVNTLYNEIDTYNNDDPTVTINGPYTLSAVDGQSYYQTSTFRVNSNTVGATINLTLQNAPVGAQIFKGTTAVTSVTAGDDIFVRVPTSSLSTTLKTFTIKGETSKTIYKAYSYQPSDISYQSILYPEVYEESKLANGTATITGVLPNTPTPTYNVTIEKKDDENNNLAGANLELYKDSVKIDNWTSLITAKVVSLEAGNYTVKETQAPAGYNKAADKQFTVSESSDKTITIIDTKIPEETYTINIYKKDDSNNPLASAILALYKGGTLIEQWTTTTSAKTISNLTAGEYTLKEVTAPNGYTKSVDQTFTLNADSTKTFTMVDTAVPEEKGSITVTKKDNTEANLAGAKISLYNAGGQLVDSWTSATDSVSHTFTDLPIGEYTLKEVTTPVGYKTANDIKVTVTNGTTQTANFINIPTSVTIKKVDENNEALAGAHLQLLNNVGTVVDEWDTDSTGLHTKTKLPVGTYTIKETKAPNGYVLKTSTKQFTITATGTLPEQVFTNAKTVVKISKKDTETGALISGANLVVYKENGDEVANFVTDGTVKEITGLEPGNYKVKEKEAPEGYALSDEEVIFNVKNDGVEVDVTMNNNKIVDVPSTSTTISSLFMLIGATFIIIGGSFIYFYVKFPKNEQ